LRATWVALAPPMTIAATAGWVRGYWAASSGRVRSCRCATSAMARALPSTARSAGP
jgi:hypothetical protein